MHLASNFKVFYKQEDRITILKVYFYRDEYWFKMCQTFAKLYQFQEKKHVVKLHLASNFKDFYKQEGQTFAK